MTSGAAELLEARDRVLERIAAACARAGRDPAGVELLPISKGVDVARLAIAVGAGITSFGENRVQEAQAKASALPGARWQLVGRLQSNKAARAVELFEVIQSVDSVDLARRLDGLASAAGRRLPVYLQVNVDADPAKAGFALAELPAALAELTSAHALELRGLMTVGRLVDRAQDARRSFVRLRRLAEQARAGAPMLGAGLSMGMSADFEQAVEEGSTLVRVGTAIFGPRVR